MCLPGQASLPQSILDRFGKLEGLDVAECETITTVDFCAATIRVLYANRCENLTSAGLQNATKLEVLHVADCRAVTSVSPFAHCLLELNVSGSCGVGSVALSQCYRLQVLDASNNKSVDTLQPSLVDCELHASGDIDTVDERQLDAQLTCRPLVCKT